MIKKIKLDLPSRKPYFLDAKTLILASESTLAVTIHITLLLISLIRLLRIIMVIKKMLSM
jgi:hypothetical protein